MPVKTSPKSPTKNLAQTISPESTHSAMEPPSQPPQEAEIEDGDTALLSQSKVLTRQEVLKRRMHRLRRLAAHYRVHYWLLMEQVRRKHREFYWCYGKSPYIEEDNVVVSEERENGNFEGFRRNDGGNNSNNGGIEEELGFGKSISWCMYKGCAAKAMALTRYCVDHIVWDSKQLLYKPCKHPLKRLEEGMPAPILCNKPILKSAIPSLCSTHAARSKKDINQVLKKGGVPAALASNISKKFNLHLVINEYVHLIQSRRRAITSSNIDNIAVDIGRT